MEMNKTIGITCSTFDLLHTGHIIMLEECKKYCDYLICAIQVDPSLDRIGKNKAQLLPNYKNVNYSKCNNENELSNHKSNHKSNKNGNNSNNSNSNNSNNVSEDYDNKIYEV